MLRQDVTFRVGNESESISAQDISRADLQGVTHSRTLNLLRCSATPGPNLLLSLEDSFNRSGMDYNELKIRVLSLFEASAELDSQRVRNLLSGTKIELSDKAVEMALLRYSRQGLLARTRRSGRFHYRMTEKGLARRIWLSKTR